ncbi:MAG TPA: hypothetical protein VNQ99_01745 [Xanthobacteraceae bacterium]|nr:hypothetical protein [Xanthobacteraceae bacterium]
MNDPTEAVSETGMEQIKIILNTLYLCLEFTMKHVADQEGPEAAAQLKENMINALKSGDINMALLEENKTFDLVISKMESLAQPQA